MIIEYLLAALSVIDMAAGGVSRRVPGKGTVFREVSSTKASREHGETWGEVWGEVLLRPEG